jgi:hypothetical protein
MRKIKRTFVIPLKRDSVFDLSKYVMTLIFVSVDGEKSSLRKVEVVLA